MNKTKIAGSLAALALAFVGCSSSGPSGAGDGAGSSSSGGGAHPGSSSGASSSGGSSGSSSSSGSSGSSSGGSSGAPTPDKSCIDLETAYCKLIFQCDARAAGVYYGGDQASCVSTLGAACALRMAAPGTSDDDGWNEGCAQALGQVTSCDAWDDTVIAACTPKPGTLADGTTCSDDAQCKGGICSYASSTTGCGACAAKPAPPGCAFDADCSNGQYCNANGACVTPGDVGATCDDQATVCKHSLYCKTTAAPDGGATSGTCAKPIAAGQACDPASDVCADGNGCSAQSTCAPLQLVAVGATCDDATQVCKGSYCLFGSGATGTCTAYVPIGGACDPQNGAPCDRDGSCVSGKCQLPAQCH